jgi:hypothetical protein
MITHQRMRTHVIFRQPRRRRGAVLGAAVAGPRASA